MNQSRNIDPSKLELVCIRDEDDYPKWLDRRAVVRFFHDHMKPYEDEIEDIEKAMDYAFSDDPGRGGYLIAGGLDHRLVGALLMLNTGMDGYVPPNILLFVGVNEVMRGSGLGTRIIRRALEECEGDVKLHVEYDNPAKRLYERIGFENPYAEMRLSR